MLIAYFILQTGEERLKGLFLIHIFIAVYLFIVLALVCDKYFLPTVERICDVLKISQVCDDNLLLITCHMEID